MSERDKLRAAIAGEAPCPFCGRGPYRFLGQHLIQAHGMTADEIREAVYLTTRDPLCSPELADTHRANARARDIRPPVGCAGRAREMTTTGRDRLIATGRASAARNIERGVGAAVAPPELRSEWSRSVLSEVRSDAARRRWARHRRTA